MKIQAMILASVSQVSRRCAAMFKKQTALDDMPSGVFYCFGCSHKKHHHAVFHPEPTPSSSTGDDQRLQQICKAKHPAAAMRADRCSTKSWRSRKKLIFMVCWSSVRLDSGTEANQQRRNPSKRWQCKENMIRSMTVKPEVTPEADTRMSTIEHNGVSDYG